MFITPAEASLEQAMAMAFRQQIALDVESGAYVYYSNGRSRAGALPKYTLVYFLAGERQAHHFRAERDSAAIAHAQTFLSKKQQATQA